MRRCPLTYEPCGRARYSQSGLKRLSPRLAALDDFPYTAEQQVEEAAVHADKMSIQGVQPKLSVVLDVAAHTFVIVDQGGRYIVKPPNPNFPQIPQNEDLTMKLAAQVGIEVPFHGLIRTAGNGLSYVIRRFDREGRNHKLAIEDFAQLLGESRDTKYAGSMERIASVIETYCTFPVLEKVKLLRLTIFNYLIGNEDMHLKNFSLITRGQKVELSPAYDLLNSTIVLRGPAEEIALPLKGKKKRLRRSDLVDYFALERLALPVKIVDRMLEDFRKVAPGWRDTIRISFLDQTHQAKYLQLLEARLAALHLA